MDKYKSLKDHVYDYIAGQIMQGELPANNKINELAICNELNISRTPVREALIQLAAEGILESTPRRGFAVKKLQPEEAHDLYVVIGLLDGLCAELACPHLTERDLQDLLFYAQCMDLAIEASNYEMYYKQQTLFHQTYAEKCGNPILVATLNQLKSKILVKSYHDDDEGRVKADFRRTNDEHLHIIELFRAEQAGAVNEYIAKTHWDPSSSYLDSF